LGAVVSGFQLAFTRVGVAVGEAGNTCGAFVCGPQLRPRTARSTACRRGQPDSGGLLAESFGWRTTFVMLGAISVVFAPLVLLVLGKRQSMPDATPGQNSHLRGAWELLNKPSYLAIAGAAACIAVAGYSVTTFAPAFLMRVHVLAAWFLALSCIAGVAYMAPSVAAIQRLAYATQRATASAVFLFFCAFFGAAGPFVTGMISDALKPEMGNMSLGRALLLIVPAMQVLAIVFYYLASRRFLREIVAA
jgi:predicted MFS family arabinose efflux permease